MTYRTARTGSAMAGALLLALPITEVAYELATPGALHVVVASLGLSLIVLSARLR